MWAIAVVATGMLVIITGKGIMTWMGGDLEGEKVYKAVALKVYFTLGENSHPHKWCLWVEFPSQSQLSFDCAPHFTFV